MARLVTSLKTRRRSSWKDSSPWTWRKNLGFLIGVAGWDASVNQVAVRNCSSVGIKGVSWTALFSSICGWNLFFQISVSLHSEFCINTAVEKGRNSKSTWVYIKLTQCDSQGFLATKLQFWKCPSMLLSATVDTDSLTKKCSWLSP